MIESIESSKKFSFVTQKILFRPKNRNFPIPIEGHTPTALHKFRIAQIHHDNKRNYNFSSQQTCRRGFSFHQFSRLSRKNIQWRFLGCNRDNQWRFLGRCHRDIIQWRFLGCYHRQQRDGCDTSRTHFAKTNPEAGAPSHHPMAQVHVYVLFRSNDGSGGHYVSRSSVRTIVFACLGNETKTAKILTIVLLC